MDWTWDRICPLRCDMLTTPLDLVDPTATMDRLLSRLGPTDSETCWLWPGAKRADGYGMIAAKCHTGGVDHYGWRATSTHRLMWHLTNGPIPAGMVIDHLCSVRACCNPAHLQVITQAENVRLQAERTPLRESCAKCGSSDWMMQGQQRKCRPCWNTYTREWQRARRPPKQCVWCGADFTPTTQNRKLCSDPCRVEYGRDFRRRAHHVDSIS